jgi:hypothetical protein
VKFNSLFLGLLLVPAIVSCKPRNFNSDSKENSVRVPWENSARLDIGKGVDAVNEDVRGFCVKFDPNDYTVPVAGNLRWQRWSFELIRSREEFERRLDVSAAAKLSFGLSRGSVKAKFSEETKTNSFSVYALLNIHTAAGRKMLRTQEFTPSALELLQNNKMEEFRAKCGDEFVVAAEYGGEFFAILEFHADSAEKRRELETAISAASSTGAADGKLDSSLKERIKNLSQKTDLKIRGFQLAGTFATISEMMAVDTMINAADRFVGELGKDINQASPLIAETDNYNVVPGYFSGKPNFVNISEQQQIISKLDMLRGQLRTKLDDIDYVLTHEREFTNINIAELQKARNTISQSMNSIYESADTCFRNITKCALPNITIPVVSIPAQSSGLVFGPHASCGVKLYKESRAAVCTSAANPPIYKTQNSRSCGTERWDAVRDPQCGVEHYNSVAAYPCPVRNYVLRTDGSVCGEDVTSSAGQVACPDGQRREIITIEPDGCYDCDKVPCSHCRVKQYKTNCYAPKTCRNPKFGIESYQTCEQPSFGVAQYKACVNPSANIGTEVFKTCAHPDHGVETYPTCRHQDFGIEEYNSCNHKP